jgi:hypothetical protein
VSPGARRDGRDAEEDFNGRLTMVTKTITAKAKPARKPSKNAKAKKGPGKPVPKKEEKKLSALDAAARVLTETKQALSCFELIAAMAAQGYWTSPGGKTPQATLSSSIQREIVIKKEQSRFRKTAPGRYAVA